MKFTKQIGVSALIAATLTFTGCTQDQENLAATAAVVGAAGAVAVAASHEDGSSKDNYYHHGHDYGENRNYSYREGVRAGCDSRQDRWNKDYNRYRLNSGYKDGWDAGYRRCR